MLCIIWYPLGTPVFSSQVSSLYDCRCTIQPHLAWTLYWWYSCCLLMPCFACDAMLPLCYHIGLSRVDSCHVVGFYFQCISCCMIVGLFVVSGDSCWVHINVLTGLVVVARFCRGFIFYFSKEMEQECARISSPARTCGVEPLQAVASHMSSAAS